MSSAKKRGRSMFDCSESLFGDSAHVPKGNAKKFTATKIAEIGGTNPANQLDAKTLKEINPSHGNDYKKGQVAAVHASSGANATMGTYKDNDVTHNLKNVKHNDAHAVSKMGVKTSDNYKKKASSKVAWTHPYRTPVTIQ